MISLLMLCISLTGRQKKMVSSSSFLHAYIFFVAYPAEGGQGACWTDCRYFIALLNLTAEIPGNCTKLGCADIPE